MCISYEGVQGPPLVGHQEGKGLYRIFSPPYRPSYRGGRTPLKLRVQVPMGERGLEPSHCNPMRQCYGPPTRKPWRLLRPSAMILRGSTTNAEKGHEPQIGTPLWWKELEAVPGITDWQKFAWKIWALFYTLEVWSRMCPEEGYSMPPTPQSLNRGVYLPDNLAYQDVRWWPALLTVAYCRCLQNWAEKCNLPRNPDLCPLAESMRELRQAICKFVNIT